MRGAGGKSERVWGRETEMKSGGFSHTVSMPENN